MIFEVINPQTDLFWNCLPRFSGGRKATLKPGLVNNEGGSAIVRSNMKQEGLAVHTSPL